MQRIACLHWPDYGMPSFRPYKKHKAALVWFLPQSQPRSEHTTNSVYTISELPRALTRHVSPLSSLQWFGPLTINWFFTMPPEFSSFHPSKLLECPIECWEMASRPPRRTVSRKSLYNSLDTRRLHYLAMDYLCSSTLQLTPRNFSTMCSLQVKARNNSFRVTVRGSIMRSIYLGMSWLYPIRREYQGIEQHTWSLSWLIREIAGHWKRSSCTNYWGKSSSSSSKLRNIYSRVKRIWSIWPAVFAAVLLRIAT